MTRTNQLLIFLSFILLCSFIPKPILEKETLILKVTNIKKAVGDIYVAIYNNKTDYMENQFSEAMIPVESKAAHEIILELPTGKYAITIFHDINQDGELSTNFLGIPKEPYGFSNNPKAKFGPPSFEESLFEFKEKGQVIEIELK